MESPTLPVKEYRYESVLKSIIIIIWWIGIWGAADTIIHLVFKGETMMELGIYFFMIVFVLLIVYMYPDLTLHF